VHRFSMAPPYTQTSVNFNNLVICIIQRIFYGVQLFLPVLLLRTLRFPEITICETTDELDWVIHWSAIFFCYMLKHRVILIIITLLNPNMATKLPCRPPILRKDIKFKKK
jgi:hypothetical protein